MRVRTASFRRGRSRGPIAFPRSHVRVRVVGPPRPIRRFREHSRDLARRREHDGRREARTNRTPGDQHELLRDVGSTRADRAFVQRIRPSRQHGPDPGTMAIVNDQGCCRSKRVSGNRHRDLRLYCQPLGESKGSGRQGSHLGSPDHVKLTRNVQGANWVFIASIVWEKNSYSLSRHSADDRDLYGPLRQVKFSLIRTRQLRPSPTGTDGRVSTAK